MKRILAVLLVMMLALSLASCVKTGGDSTTQPSATEPAGETLGTVFGPDVELTVMIGSHAGYPYDENWKIWQYVKEAMGGKITIEAIMDSWDTKVSLIMASRDQLPDVMHVATKAGVDKYALDGAFVSILDNLDKLPNFKKWMDTCEESAAYINSRKSGDGNVYHFPTYGLHTINNIRTWMYRVDIFEKLNWQLPKDWNELYELGKKYKELYPDSYPLASREKLNKLSQFGPQWKPYMQNKFYYDFVNEKWSYGITEPEFKELFLMYKKFYDEGLLPVNILTMATNDWTSLVTTDKVIMFNDYIIRIDMLHTAGRPGNPDFTVAAFPPPKGLSASATTLLPKTNSEYTGYVICNTGKLNRVANAFKYVDWFYSEEGSELTSWGKEGETYEIKDGKRVYITDANNTPVRNLHGVGTYGLYQLVDVESNEAAYSEENVASARKVLNWLEDKFNPYEWLALNEEDTLYKQQYEANFDAYVNEQLAAFFLGERPMSEWDQFIQEVRKMGLDEMLKIYDAAYKRASQ